LQNRGERGEHEIAKAEIRDKKALVLVP